MDPSRPSSACRTLRLSWTLWFSVGWDLRETSWWKVILHRGHQLRSSVVQNHFHPQWAVLLKSCKLNPAKGIASSLTVEFSRCFLFQRCSIAWRPSCADDFWRKSTGIRRWSMGRSCHVHTDHELCLRRCTCKIEKGSVMEFSTGRQTFWIFSNFYATVMASVSISRRTFWLTEKLNFERVSQSCRACHTRHTTAPLHHRTSRWSLQRSLLPAPSATMPRTSALCFRRPNPTWSCYALSKSIKRRQLG